MGLLAEGTRWWKWNNLPSYVWNLGSLRATTTWDWEPETITLQASSLVEKVELVQVRLRDQRSMWIPPSLVLPSTHVVDLQLRFSKGHFTHETESPRPSHFKHPHWWKRWSRSKFAWGTNGVCEFHPHHFYPLHMWWMFCLVNVQLHWLFHVVCVVLIPETCIILSNLKISQGWMFIEWCWVHEYMPIYHIFQHNQCVL